MMGLVLKRFRGRTAIEPASKFTGLTIKAALFLGFGLTFSLTEFLRGGLAEDTGTGVFVVVVIAALIGTAALVATGQLAGRTMSSQKTP